MTFLDMKIVHATVTILMRGVAAQGDRRRWIALAIVCLGQLMMVLDATIVNVALPAIQNDLHFSQADLTWVVDAYMIAFGSFLLLFHKVSGTSSRPPLTCAPMKFSRLVVVTALLSLLLPGCKFNPSARNR